LRNAGFKVPIDYLASLALCYVAPSRAQRLPPLYNLIDDKIFNLTIMKPLRPFALLRAKSSDRAALGAVTAAAGG
jgi:hypothetical protein